ncbi:phthiocerol/phenolphthiocerol synthesis polyketide synthase type I PpsE [Longimycelium tulufanense]|uniref:Phthiocerol/phenolphthiocerol synthesis polyketide synthase type I PpsE n=1 Tax=Longimycelium tulufanense TaxID=907463 RepID=A0A8J3CAT7_9PSEU|nr:type I polyketide synthase [Longimycelium tulufanense]GGM45955.1 phthiocerol/phenolphthiocerol synthesis polyketide synthase type I PpsE [Longimycelium tulufanense]
MTNDTNAAVPDGIAVIGLAGRFPGARDVTQFWDNLVAGRESLVTLTDDELLAEGVLADVLADPTYVKRAAPVDGLAEFDHEFFGFSPQAARITDPQQRLFLQTVWHALEDAGHDPGRAAEAVGVFATSSTGGYLIHNLLGHQDMALASCGVSMAMLDLSFGNDKDYIATRVSHALDLRGPSIAVQTACSGSLLAVHLAVQSLLSGECDIAVAGGVALRVPHRVGYFAEPGSIVSPDGHCRAFDIRANGTVFGNGVGAVVLKPLAAALEDGDPVRAVILGSAANNDGSRKMGFTAPSVTMQAAVVAEAMAVAGVEPDTVGYVEAHGTGTPLGDPVEVAALHQAFGPGRNRADRCRLGSVKTNIGHLEAASGIAGLIKAVLAVQHRMLPPTLHFTAANPELKLDRTAFTVQDELSKWESDDVRRAGVSSLGVGGTNVHVVLEEPPALEPRPATDGPRVLLLSARTTGALQRMRQDLADRLTAAPGTDLADAAFTLAEGRARHAVRLAVVARDTTDAAESLVNPANSVGSVVEGAAEQVAFLFPGQGAQHLDMAAGLYRDHEVFRARLDELSDRFAEHIDQDLRKVLFDGDEDTLRRTDIAQPALFAVCYALADLLAHHGIHPTAVAGHSIGEYVAATLAGIFTLDDAIPVVATRGRLMQRSQPGGMLSVSLPENEVVPLISDGPLSVAAVNEPMSTVVAGDLTALQRLETELTAHGVGTRRVRTAHGFHSVLMEPAVPEFEQVLAGVGPKAPTLPLTSNVTGAWMTSAEAGDPTRWAGQIRATVRFSDNVAALLSAPNRVLVEVGPGRTLTSAARRHPRWRDTHRVARLMRHQAETREDTDVFLQGLGQLWAAGVDVDWKRTRAQRPRRRVSLPGYSFEPNRHWVDPAPRFPLPAGAGGGVARLVNSTVGTDVATADEAEDSFANDTERALGAIVRDLLGIAVGPHDNFFDLGGDSVVAVHFATRAARLGLRFNPRVLFEYQTIADLAAMVGPLPEQPEQQELSVAVSVADDAVAPALTPSQWRFLRSGLRPATAWRVPVLLRLAPGIDPEQVRQALTAVVAQHEALRLRVVTQGGLPEVTVDPVPDTVELPVREHDPRSAEEILQELVREWGTEDATGAEDDVPTGPAFRAVYFASADGGPALLALGTHQLAIDEAGQEILFGDLITALEQVRGGAPVQLPPTTTPWRVWTAQLSALATHPAIQAERATWLAPELAEDGLCFPFTPAETPASPQDYARISSALSTEDTETLLGQEGEQCTRMERTLLAALGRTLADRAGRRRTLVGLTGQGRLVPMAGVNLTHTVGSCTTLYPLVAAGGSSADALEHAREQLRAVPRQGLGYGLLRELYAPTSAVLAGRPEPEFVLSYLGEIPAVPEGLAAAPCDVTHPVRLTPPGLGHAIELRCYVHNGALHLDWWYDTRRVPSELVEGLVATMPVILSELAVADRRESDRPTSNGADPARNDRPLVELSDDQFADLLAELGPAEPGPTPPDVRRSH